MTTVTTATRAWAMQRITAHAHFSTDGVSAVVLAHGDVDLRLATGTTALSPGDIGVVPPGVDVTVAPRGGAGILVLEVPAFVLEPWCPRGAGVTVARGDAARIAAELLASLHAEPPADAAVPEILAALARLLGAAVADTEAPASPDSALRARILRHVDSAIRVGAVTPRETAERFDISVRKLHQLFAGEQRTFMQAVMDRRAQWCALAMSVTPDATPTALARRWGFADSSHFAKARDRLDRP